MERASKLKRALAVAAGGLALAGILGLVGRVGPSGKASASGAGQAVNAATAAAAGDRGFVSSPKVASTELVQDDSAVSSPRSVVTLDRPRGGSSGTSGRSWWMSARFPRWGRSFSYPGLRKPAGEERRIETPAQSLPGSCTHGVCRRDVTAEGRDISTTGSESRSVDTPSVHVPGRCAGVVCIGSFSVRSVHVATTPGSEPRSYSTPDVRIPAACRAAKRACMGSTDVPGQTVLVVPASEERAITEQIAVSVSLKGAQAGFTPHVGEYDETGPYVFPVVVPEIGVIEITLCPEGCASPKTTEGSMQGELRVGVSYGSISRSATVPLDEQW